MTNNFSFSLSQADTETNHLMFKRSEEYDLFTRHSQQVRKLQKRALTVSASCGTD